MESPKSLPLVSVIIPVFNADIWIRPSYEQVRQQTYAHLEIIYIDNGSTDDSLAIIKELAKADNRLVWYEEKKKGAGSARNTGIRKAKGSILSFLDADDKIEPDKIERHVAILMANEGVELVYGKELKVYVGQPEKSYMIPMDPGLPGLKKPVELAMHWLEVFSRLPGINTITCNKDAALHIGGFEEGLLRGEDAAFLIKMALHYYCYYDDQKVGEYFRHPDSTTSTDNRGTRGNPYYIQFKRFYLPYFTQYSISTGNKKIHRFVSGKTAQALLSHTRLMHISAFERAGFVENEWEELKNMGLLRKHGLTVRLLAVLPAFASKILTKVWLKWAKSWS